MDARRRKPARRKKEAAHEASSHRVDPGSGHGRLRAGPSHERRPHYRGTDGTGFAIRRQAPPAAVDQALLPPLRMEMPDLGARAIDPHFDLAVSNAPAHAGLHVHRLRHPLQHAGASSVSGRISVNLKDVTVPEALDAIRELYGYDYKIDGRRIFIQPATMQTRVFQVNYLIGTAPRHAATCASPRARSATSAGVRRSARPAPRRRRPAPGRPGRAGAPRVGDSAGSRRRRKATSGTTLARRSRADRQRGADATSWSIRRPAWWWCAPCRRNCAAWRDYLGDRSCRSSGRSCSRRRSSR